ncbi:hypothetical protein BaRGS_00022758 [Batillaria attramentaria]|uniref:Uncharacterized protein n=1 Tax=Batillaria attramentaria TaxID=370345 RepID=A0ABD0KGC2_9CAEN
MFTFVCELVYESRARWNAFRALFYHFRNLVTLFRAALQFVVLRLELERVSQEVHHLNEEGREAFNSGNPDTAISLSETAIRLIQDSPHLLPFLTEEHAVASRNIDKALLDLEKISQEACQLNNDSFEALKSGETRRAISLCKKAMTLMHKSPYFLSEQCEIVRRNLDAAYNLHDGIAVSLFQATLLAWSY